MKIEKIMPPTWMLFAMIVMLILNFLFPIESIVPPLWNLLGLIFLAAGVMLNLVGDNAFKRARTAIKPFEESSALVTGGVYEISRNPMYLGMVLALLGIALLLRSLSPFLVILPFAILIDRTFIRAEEHMLANTFGASWKAYKANTRRWL
jgi:protein-S-isoprenylcysteine O-methyltransferase Ste14